MPIGDAPVFQAGNGDFAKNAFGPVLDTTAHITSTLYKRKQDAMAAAKDAAAKKDAEGHSAQSAIEEEKLPYKSTPEAENYGNKMRDEIRRKTRAREVASAGSQAKAAASKSSQGYSPAGGPSSGSKALLTAYGRQVHTAGSHAQLSIQH